MEEWHLKKEIMREGHVLPQGYYHTEELRWCLSSSIPAGLLQPEMQG
jgi:hypothetical protein